MVKFWRRPFRQSGETKIFIANALVVVAASLITASLALVLEDLFPRDPSDGYVVLTRWGVGIAALGVLLFGLAWRARLHRRLGTLFYVHLLDESMPNWHEHSLDAARNRRMSMRSVVRWVDLKQRTSDGVIDVVEPCHEISTAVEEAINSDRDDTGYTVAPNMLWPMALTVGAYLPHPDSLRLLELQPKSTEEEFALAGRPRVRSSSVVRRLDGQSPSGRVGVWLACTPAAWRFNEKSSQRFREFGVNHVHTITHPDARLARNYFPELSGTDMGHLGEEIAAQLVRIKHEAGERELVLVAMAPKAVMLAVGWHLSQHECRFFHGTHLMYYDRDDDSFIPVRVRESQPTTPPFPSEVEDPLRSEESDRKPERPSEELEALPAEPEAETVRDG
ncbi:hypothetical protein CDG81_03935 [Actinopolyspora erythraea]|uniref:SMODS-associated and fused to various effectors domain-containing protein n=1 Tax=Actinopolyspora erythraea TaxID=414996 RepID=A0A099D391_9ACTN|nr:hypothetical protein [Actinopolyspora erythraea]ASU77601.1 hypothetical protein CDG81_03935 [Actinopolyspora erythraea]KGI80401.1 hypothetical protein IL38_17020 [Actinopolyspora erythraea]